MCCARAAAAACAERTLPRALEIYVDRFGLDGGRVPATFEIITLTGWAPHESQQKPLQPGPPRARLADALGTKEQPAGESVPRGKEVALVRPSSQCRLSARCCPSRRSSRRRAPACRQWRRPRSARRSSRIRWTSWRARRARTAGLSGLAEPCIVIPPRAGPAVPPSAARPPEASHSPPDAGHEPRPAPVPAAPSPLPPTCGTRREASASETPRSRGWRR